MISTHYDALFYVIHSEKFRMQNWPNEQNVEEKHVSTAHSPIHYTYQHSHTLYLSFSLTHTHSEVCVTNVAVAAAAAAAI